MTRFTEGDRVRNVLVDMGTGVITRHSADAPRSIRWGQNWWVSFPHFRDPKWIDPDARGTAGWYRDDAIELTDPDPDCPHCGDSITRSLNADGTRWYCECCKSRFYQSPLCGRCGRRHEYWPCPASGGAGDAAH